MTPSDPSFATIQKRLRALGMYPAAPYPLDYEWGEGMARGIDQLLGQAEARQGAMLASPVTAPGTVAPISPAATPAGGYSFPKLPTAYKWLEREPYLPRHLIEALNLLGTIETPGAGNNPTIMAWRDELNAAGYKITGYSADSVPWCGLFIAIVMHRAGRTPVDAPLWALNWAKFGEAGGQPDLGDVLTFKRDGGGHVALMVAEDMAGYYHVLGGNQGDKVSIMRIAKARMYSCRQPAYTSRPPNLRPIIVSAAGAISGNEA